MRYRLKSNDILYFLHIPKTGGTNLYTILENNFEFNQILHEHLWEDLLEEMPINFSNYRLIRGHYGYPLYRLLPKRPIYVTMLRDPMELIISDYEYTRLHSPDVETRNLFSEKTLEELLTDPSTRLRFINIQTREIAIDMDESSFKESLLKLSSANPPSPRLLSASSDYIMEEELIKIAKLHLSEFAFFGLTEKYEESLFLLSYTFGWKPIRNTTKKNANSNRLKQKDLPKETMDSILKCVKLDMELYYYAQNLFEARFSQMVNELKNSYYEPAFESMPYLDMVYEMLEKHYDKYFMQVHTLVDSIEYTFDKVLLGDGWHGREQDPSTGKIFCWTGPGTESTIDLPLSKDRDLKIHFPIFSYVSHDIVESLQLKVNNNPIDLKKIPKEDKSVIFEGMIPKSSLQGKKSFTRLSFNVCRTISPQSVDKNSNETRLLGLTFGQISISPNQ